MATNVIFNEDAVRSDRRVAASKALREREAQERSERSRKQQRDRLEREDRDRRKDTEAEVRERVARQFQQQINATTQAFNALRERQAQEQAGRVGQTTALLAARGLGPSVRGAAIQEGTAQIGRDVETQTAAKEAESLANINLQMEQEIQRQLGEEVSAAETAAAQQRQMEIAQFLQEGVTDAQEIFQRTGGRIPLDEIVGVTEALVSDDSETVDPIRLGATDTLVVFNPETGEYEKVASGIGRAPKTTSSSGTRKLFSLTGSQQSKLIGGGLGVEEVEDVETLLNQGFTLDQIITENPQAFAGGKADALRSVFQPSNTVFLGSGNLFGGSSQTVPTQTQDDDALLADLLK